MVVLTVLLFGGLKEIKLGVLRAFGYFIAIIIMIGGTLFLPLLGLGVPFILGIIMMWALHKGGQVTAMKKDLKEIRKLEEFNQKTVLDNMKRDAINKAAMKDGWEELK